jgi:hypothetical protein
MPLSLDTDKRLSDRTIKVSQVIWSKVGEFVVFSISPDLLSRIKLRGIFRKPLDLENPGMLFQISLKQSCPVDTQSIQDKGNLGDDAFPKLLQERYNIFGRDIMLLDTPVKIEFLYQLAMRGSVQS